MRVPQEALRRRALEEGVAAYVARERLVPPLTAAEMLAHARAATASENLDDAEAVFAAVLLNNAVWADVVAGIPYERRLLLLPLLFARGTRCAGRSACGRFGSLCAQMR